MGGNLAIDLGLGMSDARGEVAEKDPVRARVDLDRIETVRDKLVQHLAQIALSQIHLIKRLHGGQPRARP